MDDLSTLIWKTNWQPLDNYGYVPGEAAPPISRLSENYQRIYEWLGKYGGGALPGYVPLGIIGATTIPFAELINQVEKDLDALKAVDVPGWLPGREWNGMDPAPTYQDINRWERNGKAIVEVLGMIPPGWRYCGTEYTGGL